MATTKQEVWSQTKMDNTPPKINTRQGMKPELKQHTKTWIDYLLRYVNMM